MSSARASRLPRLQDLRTGSTPATPAIPNPAHILFKLKDLHRPRQDKPASMRFYIHCRGRTSLHPLAHAALAADYSGLIVSVLDGDTIKLLRNPHPESMRLSNMLRRQSF